MPNNSKAYTKEQALQKLKHYCGYQERCHSEVVSKLYELGVSKKEHDEIISTLIQENYLNEERFAIQFAGGKFRMKQWGKVKIKYELKTKQVSDYCIKKALATIACNDYMHTVQKLFEAKNKTLKTEKNIFIKKRKLKDYMQQKGYELTLINELLS
jgi:regulatory protein